MSEFSSIQPAELEGASFFLGRPRPSAPPAPLQAGGVVEAWAQAELAVLDELGLQRTLVPLTSAQGAVVRLEGRELINFSSNDYLGLAAHHDLTCAASLALEEHGFGAGASRLVVGDTKVHHALEGSLARFEGTEAALLFNSGYTANISVLPALLGEGDVVFSDALNHASIIDGCRLSRATVAVYPHGDVGAARALMNRHRGRRRLLVTDAVFSMDGDWAPLGELATLCSEQGVGLMVDEAHATGVLGPTGAGLCEALGVQPDVLMGTLSKALGGLGAYVAGSRALKALLVNRGRGLVFSTALPAAVCAAGLAALERLREGSARKRLWRNIHHLSHGLTRLGFLAPPRSAIFSLVLGTPQRALAASTALERAGLLVKAIRPPTVPEGTSRLRIAVSAAHTIEQLDLLLTKVAGLLEAW